MGFPRFESIDLKGMYNIYVFIWKNREFFTFHLKYRKILLEFNIAILFCQ